MKNFVQFLIYISFLSVLTQKTLAQDFKTFVVCKTCKLKSLKGAIKIAPINSRILVKEGVYKEGVVKIEKSLKIIGEGKPVIDGLEKGHVFYVRADNVTIKGFVIKNSGQSYVSDYAGIRAEHVDSCVFEDNSLLGNTYSVYLEKSSNCLIKNNLIKGNASNEVTAGNGVHLFYSEKISVIGNEISKQRDGLYFEFTEDSVVEGNYSHGNLRFGMHFMFSHRNHFFRNIYSNNPTGVAVMYSRKLKVHDNIFEGSKGNSSYGFLIKEITDSSFIGNTFSENTLGVLLNASNRNIFEKNSFIINGWAIEVYTNSYDNQFNQNNFISNNFDVATNSTRNTNSFNANYWTQYKGYDFDRNGFGDVAYKPVSVFSFWVSRFPELSILLNSPVVNFLEIAERYFPVLTPKSLEDKNPRMKALELRKMNVDEEVANFFRK